MECASLKAFKDWLWNKACVPKWFCNVYNIIDSFFTEYIEIQQFSDFVIVNCRLEEEEGRWRKSWQTRRRRIISLMMMMILGSSHSKCDPFFFSPSPKSVF
jgi:allantoicase